MTRLLNKNCKMKQKQTKTESEIKKQKAKLFMHVKHEVEIKMCWTLALIYEFTHNNSAFILFYNIEEAIA
jgi:hypothetical protein